MTQENGGPTAEEKGKGKAVDGEPSNGKKQDEVKRDKDGKLIDGKKDGELGLPEGTLVWSRRAR